MSYLPPESRRNPHRNETVEVECHYCANTFHEDDIVSDDDGNEFCSEDCRKEWTNERAADRAEARNDLD